MNLFKYTLILFVLLLRILAARANKGLQVPEVLSKGFAAPVSILIDAANGPRSASGEIIYQNGPSNVDGLEKSKETLYIRAEGSQDTVEVWLVVKSLLWDYTDVFSFPKKTQHCSFRTDSKCQPEYTKSTGNFSGISVDVYTDKDCGPSTYYINSNTLEFEGLTTTSKELGGTVTLTRSGNLTSNSIPTLRCGGDGVPGQIFLIVIVILIVVGAGLGVLITVLQRRKVISNGNFSEGEIAMAKH